LDPVATGVGDSELTAGPANLSRVASGVGEGEMRGATVADLTGVESVTTTSTGVGVASTVDCAGKFLVGGIESVTTTFTGVGVGSTPD